MKNITRQLLAATVLLPLVATSHAAEEVDKQICIDSLEELGLPTEPYELDSGWTGATHNFGSSIECKVRKGIVDIESDGETVAEDGYFGKNALEARDATMASFKESEKQLKKERNEKIDQLRVEFDKAIEDLEKQSKVQLQSIKDGNTPEAITARIEENKAAEQEKKEREQDEKLKQAEAEREEEEACRQDAACYGGENSTAAAVYCKPFVEKFAKNSFEWTDGFLGAKFSRSGWKDKESGTVTFVGDTIQFQNGFGAMINMIYECDYNPESNVVSDVRVREGKL